jgi:hypothetical protein
MTNLTSPAAMPAAGFPNTMPDIIDSLKRLERIGDESSKTVEKIIAAAGDIERKIAQQYQNSAGSRISGLSMIDIIAKAENCPQAQAAKTLGVDFQRAVSMSYQIEWNTTYEYGVYIIEAKSKTRVSANRESALRFAADLASGLLALVELDLLTRQTSNVQALESLATAAAELRNQKERQSAAEAEALRRCFRPQHQSEKA